MLNWTTLPASEYFAAPVYPWENRLIEPGPAPIKTRDGRWLLVYNGATTGRVVYPAGQYGVGQMLIDSSGAFRPTVNASIPNPVVGGTYQPAIADGPIARIEKPMVFPSTPQETEGQVDRVTFAEGLVQFKGKWFLYFGQADSTLGVAVADVQPQRDYARAGAFLRRHVYIIH